MRLDSAVALPAFNDSAMGTAINTAIAIAIIAPRQSNTVIIAWVNGTNANCPIVPPAVAMPSQVMRRSSGAIRPTRAFISPRPQALIPIPTKNPVPRKNSVCVETCEESASPIAPMNAPPAITRTGPQRSAIIAARGAARPTTRFWVAIAIEIGSRPQFMSMLIGCMNSPKD